MCNCVTKPAEEDSENCDERVEVDNPEESDKGPVWRVDAIPQSDHTSEASENSHDKDPEITNCIKLYMEGFRNAETAEKKLRNILDGSDIEINRVKILHSQSNSQIFGIEIKDYTTLVDLK